MVTKPEIGQDDWGQTLNNALDDLQVQADSKLSLSGGTVTGVVVLNARGASVPLPDGLPSAVSAVSIPSTFDGGEDDGTGTDSTGRLNLYSYQRAQTGSFGENIRHFLMRKDAKSMDAWYFPDQGYDVNREPVGSYKPVVWTGAHWEANNHASNHKHWSVETPDSTGAIQTRFEIRWGDPTDDAAIAGLDKTLIATNLADFVVRCTNGQQLRLSSPLANGDEKAIEFNHDYEGTAQYRRWKVRATGEAETGSNAGTNFQVVRYDDAGVFLDAPLAIDRASGSLIVGQGLNHNGAAVGFYGTTPAAKPTVTGSRADGTALSSLLTALATLGLITDSTTA